MSKFKELKKQANKSLKGNRAIYVLEFLTVFLISIFMDALNNYYTSGLVHASIYILILLFIQLLALGCVGSSIRLTNEEGISYSNLFDSFKNNFTQRLMLVVILLIIYVVSLICLIVPCIYLKFRLGLASYIIVDRNCTAIEAIKESWRLTKGHTLEYFLLTLSFIGWFVLVIITLGIASLWIVPYYTTTVSYFYKDLKVYKPN